MGTRGRRLGEGIGGIWERGAVWGEEDCECVGTPLQIFGTEVYFWACSGWRGGLAQISPFLDFFITGLLGTL